MLLVKEVIREEEVLQLENMWEDRHLSGIFQSACRVFRDWRIACKVSLRFQIMKLLLFNLLLWFDLRENCLV